LNFSISQVPGMKVTIMGLGLHGGGAASAAFFAEHGAEVTVTDLQERGALKNTIAQLHEYPITYVLGEHRNRDFEKADLVIKNPAVPSTSPFLRLAPVVESDISVFLSLVNNPVIAITGSKGKSTVASAVQFVLEKAYSKSYLGGNITVSPLLFVDEILKETEKHSAPVVLELSSWQLADLRGKEVCKPKISVITNILPDHQNRYSGMDDYIEDKKVIYQEQGKEDTAVFNYDDPYTRIFEIEAKAEINYFSSLKKEIPFKGGWLENRRGIINESTKPAECFADDLKIPGRHNALNLLCSGIILNRFGVPLSIIREQLPRFPGISHRLEFTAEKRGVLFYNDSAATIPHASYNAIHSFSDPIHLILGGTDKELDFSILEESLSIPASLHLLEGSATKKIISICMEKDIPFNGPYPDIESAVKEAYLSARAGEIVVMSPGCASFGMFKNEFHRGDRFKESVLKLAP